MLLYRRAHLHHYHKHRNHPSLPQHGNGTSLPSTDLSSSSSNNDNDNSSIHVSELPQQRRRPETRGMLSVAPAEIPATALVEEGGTSKDSTHHSNISTTGNVAGTPLTRICPLLVSHGSNTSAQRRPKKNQKKRENNNSYVCITDGKLCGRWG